MPLCRLTKRHVPGVGPRNHEQAMKQSTKTAFMEPLTIMELLRQWQTLTKREQDIIIHRCDRPGESLRESARTLKISWTQYQRARLRILKTCPNLASLFR